VGPRPMLPRARVRQRKRGPGRPRARAPDLLLSDLDLPGLPGELLAERARALALPPTIVFMSADATRLERAGGGADAILEKPFSLVDALGLVEACLMARGGGLHSA